MNEVEILLITLGSVFLIGLVADLIGRRTALPRVTLLIVIGLIIGSSGLDLLPESSQAWFPGITNIALVMVGFLVGGSLTLTSLRQHGRLILIMSVSIVVVTALVVLAGLAPVGLPIAIPILFAGVATSTDPVATVAVIDELKSRGRFPDLIRAIVALDDAWGLIAFSILVVFASSLTAGSASSDFILQGLWEVAGGVLLGLILGLPMAYLTGRIQKGEPTQAEAVGMVLLCGGMALWLDVSFLLAAMTMGMIVANLARHHRRPFHAIEGIEWPFMVLFFVLSGASVELSALPPRMLLFIAGYVALRVAGRLMGGMFGAACAGEPVGYGARAGLALLPQAGVALGMTLIASERFPDIAPIVLPTVVAATVIFEVIGPVATRYALLRNDNAA